MTTKQQKLFYIIKEVSELQRDTFETDDVAYCKVKLGEILSKLYDLENDFNYPFKSLDELKDIGSAKILITNRGEIFEGWKGYDGNFQGKYYTPADPVVAWTENFPDFPTHDQNNKDWPSK